MDADKISLIHRVYGDATDIVGRLGEVLTTLKYPISNREKDEVLYHLRRVVDKCDNIASGLEKVFAEEMPKE
jgi:hypothetical protein